MWGGGGADREVVVLHAILFFYPAATAAVSVGTNKVVGVAFTSKHRLNERWALIQMVWWL